MPVQLPEAFWSALTEAPFEHDLFQLLRRVDAQAAVRQRLGRAAHPRDEPLRVGQEPSLSFAPSTIARIEPRAGSPLHELSIYSFGLFGPNGSLPLHWTEYVRDRVQHHQDRAMLAFCNLFHHRLTLLFFRAWANAQPTVSLDRHDNRRFDQYLSCLIGLGSTLEARRDGLQTHAKYFLSGHLARQVRSAEGLQKIIASYFEIPARILQNMPMWLRIERKRQFRLQVGRQQAGLGIASLLGIAVRDVQHKFRIVLGPLSSATYARFLPDGDLLHQLRDWVRQYLGFGFAWDLQLILEHGHACHAQLGAPRRLGLDSWLRHPVPDPPVPSDQLIFVPEPLERDSDGLAPSRPLH